MKWEKRHAPSFTTLAIYLDPGEAVTAEAGAFLYGLGDFEVKTSTGGLLSGLARAVLGGESLFFNTYVARGAGATLVLAPHLPGDVEYIPLKGEEWFIQDASYLAHHGDVKVSVGWRGARGWLAQGELVWLKASGTGGVWVSAYGAVEKIELGPGQSVIVDNNHFVAMPATMRWRTRKLGGVKSFLFGGEGIVMEVEGPGVLYIQTRILDPLAALIVKLIGQR
ncbi:MAG: TIGR00266 family protein [Pyrobaculum sp.]